MTSLFRNLAGAVCGAALVGLVPMAAHATSSATTSLSSWETAVGSWVETPSTTVPLVNSGNTLKLNSGNYLKIQQANTGTPTTSPGSTAGWANEYNGSTTSASSINNVILSSAGNNIVFRNSTALLPTAITADYGFGFYVMPTVSGTWAVTAKATDNTSISENVTFGTADFIGFYNLGAANTSITLTATCVSSCEGSTGLAVGDFLEGNPVPEPASMALLGAGMAGLGFIRRRRSRKTS